MDKEREWTKEKKRVMVETLEESFAKWHGMDVATLRQLESTDRNKTFIMVSIWFQVEFFENNLTFRHFAFWWWVVTGDEALLNRLEEFGEKKYSQADEILDLCYEIKKALMGLSEKLRVVSQLVWNLTKNERDKNARKDS